MVHSQLHNLYQFHPLWPSAATSHSLCSVDETASGTLMQLHLRWRNATLHLWALEKYVCGLLPMPGRDLWSVGSNATGVIWRGAILVDGPCVALLSLTPGLPVEGKTSYPSKWRDEWRYSPQWTLHRDTIHDAWCIEHSEIHSRYGGLGWVVRSRRHRCGHEFVSAFRSDSLSCLSSSFYKLRIQGFKWCWFHAGPLTWGTQPKI